MKADLVVAADGVHSAAVKFVIGRENPAVSKGMSVFRWLARTDEILGDTETEALFGEQKGLSQFWVDDTGKRIICYPCREYVPTIQRKDEG